MIIVLVFVLIFIFFHWLTIKPRNFPPGPPCIPLFGSAPFITVNNFHFYMERVKPKYGPVIGIKIGPTNVVGITGAAEAKEVLKRPEFQGRPTNFVKPGIMFSEGQFWVSQRKFTIRHLRNFGFGKKSLENDILEEADIFCKTVLAKKDKIQVSGLFNFTVINVLWSIMGGKRYSYDDEEFKNLLNAIQKKFRSGNVTGGLTRAVPIFKKLLSNLKFFKEEEESDALVEKFIQNAIDEHKQTKNEEPQDFIDVYLKKIDTKEVDPSFSEDTLINVCVDLFQAGSESIGNTLGFCLLYSVLYPEWQETLYREIRKYVEIDGSPYLKNRKSFPKLEAFISEVNRCNTIATIAVPHKALQDTSLSGYFIPKNTILLISIWSILQDKNHWKDPENFRPERFLDEEGNYKRSEGWLPIFGLGQRICPGEIPARNIIFIFLISLISKFKFSIPEGQPQPKTVCLGGFTNAVQPFEVKIERRN